MNEKRFLLVFLSLALSASACRAEDWTTTDGKTYKGVTVVKLEADAVTILYDDGGALVPLEKLSPELQKKFLYNPAKAAAAAAQRQKDEEESNASLAAERALVAQKKAAALAAGDQLQSQQKASWTKSQIQADIARINARLDEINYERGSASAAGQHVTQQQINIYNSESFELRHQLKEDRAAMGQISSN